MTDINTIQEITLQAYAFGIYATLQNEEYNMSREDVFDKFVEWAEEFENAHKDYERNGDYYDEIDAFLEAKKAEL